MKGIVCKGTDHRAPTLMFRNCNLTCITHDIFNFWILACAGMTDVGKVAEGIVCLLAVKVGVQVLFVRVS